MITFFDSVDLILHHALNVGSKNQPNQVLNAVNGAGTCSVPTNQLKRVNYAMGHSFRMCRPYLLMIFERLGLKQIIFDLVEFLKLANNVNLFCLSKE